MSNDEVLRGILQRATSDVSAKTQRIQAIREAGLSPPEDLVDELQSDTSYLDYLTSLVK